MASSVVSTATFRVRRASDRHGKDAGEKDAENSEVVDAGQLFLSKPCKTGLDGISGIPTGDETLVKYDYVITTDESIESDVEGIVLPDLEEYINNDLAGIFMPGCRTSGRRMEEVMGIVGISVEPQDRAQDDAFEFCPGPNDVNEACDFVKGGLTVYTDGEEKGATEAKILHAIRAGMTTNAFAHEARYVQAHPAILGIRFVEHESSRAIVRPSVASESTISGVKSTNVGGSPRWVVGILIAAAVVFVLLIVTAIYQYVKRSQSKKEEDSEKVSLDDKDFVNAEGSLSGDKETVGTVSPPYSPVQPKFNDDDCQEAEGSDPDDFGCGSGSGPPVPCLAAIMSC